MADIPFPRILSIADRAYRALLYVYPAAHRREYGPWMAQLFRDLCQNAVQQDGTFGLARLWMRTLFDVARTAIIEHLEEKGRVPMTSILATKGLVPALEDLIGRLEEEIPFAVHLAIEGDVPRLSGQAESALFDMVQEAVSNARAHAEADHVWIAVRRRQDALEVSVKDDGRGFDLAAVQADLRSRDRFESIQGDLSVESAVGKGTTVRLVSPLTPNLAAASG